MIKKHTNIGLISPNKGKLVKIKKFNSDFEQEIYKNRWTIEKIFKLIKNNRGVYDLEFIAKGNVSFNLKKSLTHLVCLMYNLEI